MRQNKREKQKQIRRMKTEQKRNGNRKESILNTLKRQINNIRKEERRQSKRK